MKLKVVCGDAPAIIVEDGQKLVFRCDKDKAKSDIVIETIGEREKLSAPSLAIDGDTLTITDTSGVAEQFIIYSNGKEIARTEDKIIDLSSLISIDFGILSITAVAMSTGYDNSEASEAIEYRVGKELSGTWLVHEKPMLLGLNGEFEFVQSVSFSSNSEEFGGMEIYGSFVTDGWIVGYLWISYGGMQVCRYTTNGYSVADTLYWRNENYRYVTFDGVQLVSKSFYKAFRKIATQQ